MAPKKAIPMHGRAGKRKRASGGSTASHAQDLLSTTAEDVERKKHKKNPFGYLEFCLSTFEEDDDAATGSCGVASQQGDREALELATTNVHVRLELIKGMKLALARQAGDALKICRPPPPAHQPSHRDSQQTKQTIHTRTAGAAAPPSGAKVTSNMDTDIGQGVSEPAPDGDAGPKFFSTRADALLDQLSASKAQLLLPVDNAWEALLNHNPNTRSDSELMLSLTAERAARCTLPDLVQRLFPDGDPLQAPLQHLLASCPATTPQLLPLRTLHDLLASGVCKPLAGMGDSSDSSQEASDASAITHAQLPSYMRHLHPSPPTLPPSVPPNTNPPNPPSRIDPHIPPPPSPHLSTLSDTTPASHCAPRTEPNGDSQHGPRTLPFTTVAESQPCQSRRLKAHQADRQTEQDLFTLVKVPQPREMSPDWNTQSTAAAPFASHFSQEIGADCRGGGSEAGGTLTGRECDAAAGNISGGFMMGRSNHTFDDWGDTGAHLQLEDILIRPVGAPLESQSKGDDECGDCDTEGGEESQGGGSWGCAVTGGNEGIVGDAECSGGGGDQIEDEIMDDISQGELDHAEKVRGKITTRPLPTAPHLSRHVSRAYGEIRNNTLTNPEEKIATQTRPLLQQNSANTSLIAAHKQLEGGLNVIVPKLRRRSKGLTLSSSSSDGEEGEGAECALRLQQAGIPLLGRRTAGLHCRPTRAIDVIESGDSDADGGFADKCVTTSTIIPPLPSTHPPIISQLGSKYHALTLQPAAIPSAIPPSDPTAVPPCKMKLHRLRSRSVNGGHSEFREKGGSGTGEELDMVDSKVSKGGSDGGGGGGGGDSDSGGSGGEDENRAGLTERVSVENRVQLAKLPLVKAKVVEMVIKPDFSLSHLATLAPSVILRSAPGQKLNYRPARPETLLKPSLRPSSNQPDELSGYEKRLTLGELITAADLDKGKSELPDSMAELAGCNWEDEGCWSPYRPPMPSDKPLNPKPSEDTVPFVPSEAVPITERQLPGWGAHSPEVVAGVVPSRLHVRVVEEEAGDGAAVAAAAAAVAAGDRRQGEEGDRGVNVDDWGAPSIDWKPAPADCGGMGGFWNAAGDLGCSPPAQTDHLRRASDLGFTGEGFGAEHDWGLLGTVSQRQTGGLEGAATSAWGGSYLWNGGRDDGGGLDLDSGDGSGGGKGEEESGGGCAVIFDEEDDVDKGNEVEKEVPIPSSTFTASAAQLGPPEGECDIITCGNVPVYGSYPSTVVDSEVKSRASIPVDRDGIDWAGGRVASNRNEGMIGSPVSSISLIDSQQTGSPVKSYVAIGTDGPPFTSSSPVNCSPVVSSPIRAYPLISGKALNTAAAAAAIHTILSDSPSAGVAHITHPQTICTAFEDSHPPPYDAKPLSTFSEGATTTASPQLPPPPLLLLLRQPQPTPLPQPLLPSPPPPPPPPPPPLLLPELYSQRCLPPPLRALNVGVAAPADIGGGTSSPTYPSGNPALTPSAGLHQNPTQFPTVVSAQVAARRGIQHVVPYPGEISCSGGVYQSRSINPIASDMNGGQAKALDPDSCKSGVTVFTTNPTADFRDMEHTLNPEEFGRDSGRCDLVFEDFLPNPDGVGVGVEQDGGSELYCSNCDGDDVWEKEDADCEYEEEGEEESIGHRKDGFRQGLSAGFAEAIEKHAGRKRLHAELQGSFVNAALAQTAGANGSLEPLIDKMLRQLESLSLNFTGDTVSSLSALSAACNSGITGASVNPPASQQRSFMALLALTTRTNTTRHRPLMISPLTAKGHPRGGGLARRGGRYDDGITGLGGKYGPSVALTVLESITGGWDVAVKVGCM